MSRRNCTPRATPRSRPRRARKSPAASRRRTCLKAAPSPSAWTATRRSLRLRRTAGSTPSTRRPVTSPSPRRPMRSRATSRRRTRR
ncbi:hypothetical protein FPH17_08595 [Corynebacterium godavarianum]|uniref:Uncharacterized protein n=1 Tax=Corynebacterium godavarianum TaxID=2054421 RepID=A0ABY3E0I8_9CORY|nr:hypothetical protein FPH17_08595 [Corynebacterium godavarianum]